MNLSLLQSLPDAARVKRELDWTPVRLREDAVQEAWLAHLRGANPVSAIQSFRRRSRKAGRREIACGGGDSDDMKHLGDYRGTGGSYIEYLANHAEGA